MSSRRDKSPGWAALDLQNKQKQVQDPKVPAEPFPFLSNSTTLTPRRSSKTSTTKNKVSVRPFSAAIVPSVGFVSVRNKSLNIASEVGTSSGRHNTKVPDGRNKLDHISKKLKGLYSWADDSLIEDILETVNDDYEKASASLKAMVSGKALQEYKDTRAGNSSYSSRDSCLDRNPSSFPGACFSERNRQLMNEPGKFDNDDEEMKLILSQFAHILIEPEWEGDDVYMSHRKDALKMMREASRHSKAASNAYMRGDHTSAQQYSRQARSARAAAEKLNEKASHEILSMHNCENGMWKLDLHGLHATEAVLAVQVRLREIESHVLLNVSQLPGSDVNLLSGFNDMKKREIESQELLNVSLLPHSAVNLFSGFNDMKKRYEQAWFKQTPMVLEVITGVGRHSRGASALPGAVRSFLIDNRYRFDEPRPGVIFVRPKFRDC